MARFGLICGLFLAIALALACVRAVEQPTLQSGQYPPQTQIDHYKGIFFENLMYSGTNAIVAARSKSYPDYWYDWSRDSALAMMAVERVYGTNSTQVGDYYYRYETFAQQAFFGIPSGQCDVRAEAKFFTNGDSFSGPWAHNQLDGPATRTYVRINYLKWLLSRGRTTEVENLYRRDNSKGGIKWELEYVKNNWSSSTFDAWEECDCYSLYTLMMARKSMYAGAVAAYQLQDYDYALELLFTAANINNAIPKHYNDKDGMIFPMINSVCSVDRKSMDIVVHLATLNGYIDKKLMADVQGISKAWYDGMQCATRPTDQRCSTLKSYLDNWNTYGDAYWTQPRPHHGYNLFNLWNLSNWSRDNFAIGKQFPTLLETAIARYAYDVYDGTGVSRGNPWILSSFTASQTWSRAGQYFNAIAADKYETKFSFQPQHYWMWLDFINKSRQCTYFKPLLDTLYAGQQYVIDKTQFKDCAASLRDMFYTRADDAFMVPFHYLGYADNLSEQIHRDGGYAVGAPFLTWSYSTLIFADYDRSRRTSDPE